MSQTNQQSPEPRRRPRRRKNGGWAMVRNVLGTLLLVGVVTCAILACFATVYIRAIIMPQAGLKLTEFSMDLTSKMYYFDPESGERKELQSLHGDENRVWVKYDEIPQDMIDAAVAIEDKTFWTNSGVNWKRTIGAFGNMFLQMKDNFGGSTITQQLIKNVTGEDDVTVKRKILEIFRALEFNDNYSKETTMEWYLNYIFLGENCNGVYTASYAYFGKHVSQLSLAECASLVGITNNPSRFNPYLKLVITDPETGEERTNIQRNKERQEVILSEMFKQGYITQEEYDQAVAEELVFVRGANDNRPQNVYSWYEDQVITDVVNDLMEKYDMSKEAASLAVYNSGLEIETCYNPKVQAAVDQVYENLENLAYISPTGQQLQSAITIVDNETGDIVALSGGMGEKAASRLSNRATAAIRQPGSSIKPIAVYAPAIELGLINPGTVLDDTPINLNGKAWPVNSYSHYRGRMTVFEAVEDSSNPVAVRVMRDYITPQVSYDFLTGKLGMTTLVAARQGKDGNVYSDIDVAPLSLGGLTDGTSTAEMAAAYAAFPRMGVYTTPRTYSRVLDAQGQVVLEKASASSVAMKESTAFYINDLLKNVVAAGTGKEANFSGMEVAGKTGTTTNNYDRWFVGYTPYYTAAVWTGYDQNERLKVTGNPAARLWKGVMSQVHEGLTYRGFAEPADAVVSQSYCRDSGMLASDYCPNDARGSRVTSSRFIAQDAPTQYCTIHIPVTLCKEDPILDSKGDSTGMYHLAGPYCPTGSKVSVAVLDYERNMEGVSFSARDDHIMHRYLEGLGTCKVHLTAPEPEPPVYDPNDPSTWPWDDELPDDLPDNLPNERPPEADLPTGQPSEAVTQPPTQADGAGWHWPWEN